MPNQWTYLTAFLSGFNLIHGAIDADKVTSLPGFDGTLPSTHYSGLIPVGTLSGVPGHLHYWFIESESDPANDPVVLWLNGGCSLLFLTNLFRTRLKLFDWFTHRKWSNYDQ